MTRDQALRLKPGDKLRIHERWRYRMPEVVTVRSTRGWEFCDTGVMVTVEEYDWPLDAGWFEVIE